MKENSIYLMCILSPCPIIFSGHNDRAVVALCRFFYKTGLPFFLVARHGLDAIFQTEWHKYVLFQREDAALSLGLMKEVALRLKEHNLSPFLCPTSEFLNHFVLNNRRKIESLGWDCALPERGLYLELSDKLQSPIIIGKLTGLETPSEQPLGKWSAPCVIKPKRNVVDGGMMYPMLCHNSLELEIAMGQIDSGDWFSQKWIEGQSIYLCAYLGLDGHFDSFWQENLLQQPHGKSIVLAQTTVNPGIDVNRLMGGLHDKGYFGPFMMEVMRDESDRLYFIEVNPRFWGPLNLALKACPNLLSRFCEDHGLTPKCALTTLERPPYWYAWAFGARKGHCRRYPRIRPIAENMEIDVLLHKYDVYAEKDTQDLHGKH